MNPFKLFVATICSLSTAFTSKPPQSIYNLSIKSISNETIDLGQYKDKYILFVNVASKCGFTKQYKDLQKLHETYKDRLVVIGLPCNQFGKQEPGNAKTIQEFCSVNYSVSFPITEKIEAITNALLKSECNSEGRSPDPFKFAVIGIIALKSMKKKTTVVTINVIVKPSAANS